MLCPTERNYASSADVVDTTEHTMESWFNCLMILNKTWHAINRTIGTKTSSHIQSEDYINDPSSMISIKGSSRLLTNQSSQTQSLRQRCDNARSLIMCAGFNTTRNQQHEFESTLHRELVGGRTQTAILLNSNYSWQA